MKDTDENIGVIRLDKKLDAEGNDAAEISLTIDPKYAGKGYEKRGITFIIAGSEERLFQAVTHKDSMSSRKVFVANGFVYRANHQDSFDLFVFEKVSTK